MEIKGRVISVSEVRRGTSQRGTQWASQDFVLQTDERYPKLGVFNVYGEDNVEKFNVKEGDMATVSFDLNGREYNGKYYNNPFSVFKYVKEGGSDNAPAQAAQSPKEQDAFAEQEEADGDGLPF